MTARKLFTFIVLSSLLNTFSAYAAPRKMQICTMKCQTDFCKKIAQEVEFEFELLPEYLLPPCKSASAPLAKKEFRVVFLDHKGEGHIEVELDCLRHKTCLNQTYERKDKNANIVAKIIKDLRAAIRLEKPLDEEAVLAQTEAPVIEPVVAAIEPPKEVADEWDHVVVPLPSEVRPPPTESVTREEALVFVQREKRPVFGSATLSFGGENWNYAFDSDLKSERLGSVHSRIYPKVTLSAAFWLNRYIRFFSAVGACVAGLRIKANQPVEGDGRIVLSQMYQGSLLVGAYKSIGDWVNVGADVGYDFQGVFVEPQLILDKRVTVAPSFQAHGLRLGPRLIFGSTSDSGMLDISAGFYPYHFYEESPDEPTTHKELFSWNLNAIARLMLSSEIYADATLRAQVFHVHYTDTAVRETADGEKWGSGRVTNVSTSAMVGLGWLF